MGLPPYRRMELARKPFWTAAMMLEHVGEVQAVKLLMEAVESAALNGIPAPHLGGNATTYDATRAVCEAIAAAVTVTA